MHGGSGVCLGDGQTEACLRIWYDGPGVCLGDGQTEAYLKDMGMAGLASVWATPAYVPIPHLTCGTNNRDSRSQPFEMNDFYLSESSLDTTLSDVPVYDG